MKNKLNLQFGLVTLMIIMAALSRLLPHPDNFTPIAATALFGAAYFTKKYWAIIIPIVALWLSDLFLNNLVYPKLYPEYYDGFMLFGPDAVFVYSAIIATALLGIYALKKVKPGKLVIVSIVASLLFFVVTNFGSWLMLPMYPKTPAGLSACMAAGLPFLRNTMIGDLFYVFVLFGSYALISRKLFKLSPQNA